MAYSIKFSEAAQKDLKKLDREVAKRILRVLYGRVANLEDPRSIGEALRGEIFWKYWKYRVGDYRIIAQITDKTLEILIIQIGNRREIYR